MRNCRIFGCRPGTPQSDTDRALPQSDRQTDRASSGPVRDSLSAAESVCSTGCWLGSNRTVSDKESETELGLLASSNGLSSWVVGWLVRSSGLTNKANSAEDGD